MSCLLVLGCSSGSDNQAQGKEQASPKSEAALENEAGDSGKDSFINFIGAFQDESPPFDLASLPNAGEVDSVWIVRYIDPDYPNVLARERQVAEKDGGESYYHLTYYHSVRVVISPDFYTVVFYQMREGIGPNGLLTVANYDLEGKIVGRVDLDVVDVFLDQAVKVVVEQDGVSVYGGKNLFYMFAKNGEVQ